MNHRQTADLASLHRVQDCLDIYAEQLAVVDLAHLRGKLDECVGRMDMAVADQAESRVSARSNARVVNQQREDLIRHLDPIVEFARSKLAKTGSMQDLKLPADDATEIEVVAIATATADLAAQYLERFLELGLPPRFIEELREATARYEAAIRAREVSKMVRYGAKLFVKCELPTAAEIVRLMGALIKREFGGQPHLIEAWQHARLHAPRQPRLRAPETIKLLPQGAGSTVIAESTGGVAADQVPAEGPTAIAATVQQPAFPAGPERHSLVRRVFRFFGNTA